MTTTIQQDIHNNTVEMFDHLRRGRALLEDLEREAGKFLSHTKPDSSRLTTIREGLFEAMISIALIAQELEVIIALQKELEE